MTTSRMLFLAALVGASGAVSCDLAPTGSEPSFAAAPDPASMALLGERLFTDENLSVNRNQSCASCHDPAWGFTGPLPAINEHGAVYEGSIPGRFGDRKPPSSAYATSSPILFVGSDGFVGGNFWDGRATGEKLGNPAADQAQGPFLNPAEQALPDAACVVYRVSVSDYVDLYETVWGAGIRTIPFPLDTDVLCGQENTIIPLAASDRASVDLAYDRIALAIAAFEDSPASNAFTSRFDASRGGGGMAMTMEERRGFALFQGKGGCAHCHPSQGREALFTDFTYDNLGIPANPENPALLADPAFVDRGLGGFLLSIGYDEWEEEIGKVKVPTLRNVDRRPYPGASKAYGHNGYFKTLEDIVHFYNTRDVLPECATVAVPEEGVNCWPPPEVALNVNRDELGDLGLTRDEELAIVAFLRTLTDGYVTNR